MLDFLSQIVAFLRLSLPFHNYALLCAALSHKITIKRADFCSFNETRCATICSCEATNVFLTFAAACPVCLTPAV